MHGSDPARPSAGAAWAPSPAALDTRPRTLAGAPVPVQFPFHFRFRFRERAAPGRARGPCGGAAMAATAGSRTQKIGSIFSRARNLVRIGLLRKPLWLDVYAAFPPLREPVYRVPRPRYGSGDPIGAVLYREDTVRAVLHPGMLPRSPSSRLCSGSCRTRGRTGRSSHQSWQGHRRRVPVPPDSAVTCQEPPAALLGDISLRSSILVPSRLVRGTPAPSVQLHIDKLTDNLILFNVHNCFLIPSWKITSVKVEN
uniref:Small ribosomal subunit protein mS23 n=1 Tax=Junco hyemalis TaxID=40217 RepID=A0A8C5JJ60_JUNHY